jgi:hypothetical protein
MLVHEKERQRNDRTRPIGRSQRRVEFVRHREARQDIRREELRPIEIRRRHSGRRRFLSARKIESPPQRRNPCREQDEIRNAGGHHESV